MSAEPWQRAEVPGPIKATPVRDAKSLAATILRHRKPLIVVGGQLRSVEGVDMVSYVMELARLIDAHVVVTDTLIREFHEKGFKEAVYMPALEVAHKLRDPEWMGVDGRTKYDLAIFVGFNYYYGWVIMSGLKHYAYKDLRTLSLDPYYHPNATWSVATMPHGMWLKLLESLLGFLKEQKEQKQNTDPGNIDGQ